MKDRKAIQQKARRFVAAVEGVLGPRSLQRVVREELTFFTELRAAGASWDQITALLKDEGLRSRRGEPVSADVLRTLVSRAIRQIPSSPPSPRRRDAGGSTNSASVTAKPDQSHEAVKATKPAGLDANQRNEVTNRIRRAATLRSGNEKK